MENVDINSFEKSPKLKAFLVGFRVIALLLGLFLTSFNDPDAFKPVVEVRNSRMAGIVFTLVLLGFHVVAGMWTLKFHSSMQHMKPLVIIDALFGLVVLCFLGSPYAFVAIALPACEARCYAGKTWSLFVFGLCGIIFACMLIGEFPRTMNIPQPDGMSDEVFARMIAYKKDLLGSNLLYYVFLIPSVLWAFYAAVEMDREKIEVYLNEQNEKKIIIETSKSDKETIQGLSNALIDKEQSLEAAKERMRVLQEEADKNYRKYHEQKNQAAAQTESFRNKENEMTTSFDSRLKKIQLDNAELAAQLKRSDSLVKIAVDLNKSLNLQESYVSVIERLIKLVPVQTCILFMLDTVDKRTEIFAEMVYSPYSEFFRNFSVKIGSGIVGMAAELQKTLKADSGFVSVDGRDVQGLLSYEKSSLAVPILYEEEILGVLYLGRKEEFAFTSEEVELVNSYSSIAAVPLQNAQLFQKTISGGIFDDITGLYNAVYFNERFGEEVKRGRFYKTPLSIALVDIDNFGVLSEEFGGTWAEDVLREVSDVIREEAGETCVSARIQAGQFSIVLPDCDKKGAYMAAEKIRTSFETRNMNRMRRSRASTTLSLGVATFPYDSQTKEGLVTAVEEALDNSRKSGGNKTAVLQIGGRQ